MAEPDIYVSLPKYTILLVIEDGVVVEAPPIARWTIGKTRWDILQYFMQRSAVIHPVF